MRLFVLFLILFAIYSCAPSNKPGEQNEHFADIKCDTISVDLDNLVSVGINTYKCKAIVPLETNRDFLIGYMYRVDLLDDKFVVCDRERESILIFDKNGKGKACIDRKGKGPREYLFLEDYFCNKTDKTINIPDLPRKRILQYNLTGKYIGKISFNDYINYSFTIESNGKFCFNFQDNLYGIDNNEIWIYNADGKFEDKFLKSRPYMMDLIPHDINNPITLYSDTTYFLRRYDHYIYGWDGINIFKRYYIDFGKNTYTKTIILNQKNSQKDVFFPLGLPQSIQNIFITRKFIFFSIDIKNNYLECFYDKQSKKTYLILRYFFNKSNNTNIQPGRVVGATDDFFIYQVSALNFMRQVDYLKEQNCGSIHHLDSIYQNVNVEDNPLLLLYEPVIK